MLTEISSKGFKGMEFTQALGQKNLIVGRNGSGKSARTNAAMLLVLGYVPGCEKQNAKILETFGSGDKLFVSGKIGQKHFLRRFSATSKGSVSQDFMVDRKKATKALFIEEMAKAGKPTILDLGDTFTSLSDQKKINYLFDLFPPAEGVSSITEQIDDLAASLSQKQEEFSSRESVVKALTKAHSEIDLPSGTLAETRGEIQLVSDDYKRANKELMKAREGIAAAGAKEKAEKEAKDNAEKANAKADGKAPEKPISDVAAAGPDTGHEQNDTIPGDGRDREEQIERAESSLKRRVQGSGIVAGDPVVAVVERILEVAKRTDAMAVVMICTKELRARKEAAWTSKF